MAAVSNIMKNVIDSKEFQEIISNHFENLKDPVVISIGINPNTKVEDVVNTLQQAGMKAVPYYSDKAIDDTCFIVDDTGIRSPYVSADDSLLVVKDIYNALKAKGIPIRGYALPMNAENLTRCITPKDDRQIDIICGNQEIKDFIYRQLNLVKETPKIDIKAKADNKTSLYRGGTLGNQPYAITGSRCARNVCYATPDIMIASKYADGGFSTGVGYLPIDGKKYGFIYEFETDGKYKKYSEYGIEHRKEMEAGEEIHETPIFPHKNPLKAIYLQYGEDVIQIADKKGYFSNDWERFAQLHEVYSQNEKNNIMINRINNLKEDINAGRECVVPYSQQTIENNEIYINKTQADIEILEHFIFRQNISDDLHIKNANLSSINLPNVFNKVEFEGNLTLKNISGLKHRVLDLSKCNGDIFLENIDLSECDNLILPKQCNRLCLSNVKLPQNVKSLDIEKCNDFILFNQDLSSIEKIKFPRVNNKIRFWGRNIMPQTVDISNISVITEAKEKENLDFSKTEKLITKDSFWIHEKVEILKRRPAEASKNINNQQIRKISALKIKNIHQKENEKASSKDTNLFTSEKNPPKKTMLFLKKLQNLKKIK